MQLFPAAAVAVGLRGLLWPLSGRWRPVPGHGQGFCGGGEEPAARRGLRPRSAARRTASDAGLIFAPGDEGEGWWDARNAASPVVLPPSAGSDAWRMWYYGRAGTKWARDVNALLPTGRIGMASSADGIKWSRVRGGLPGGACLDPSTDPEAFDCIHVGVGDVVELPNQTLWMYYFGGGYDEIMKDSPGLGMQIGLAASDDGGVTWTRQCNAEPVLRPGGAGEFDALFVSWPRVLPPWRTEGVPGIPPGKWYMSYHTASFSGGRPSWAAGAAFSDDGVSWTKAPGPVLSGGGEGLWDSKGVGVRSVAVAPDGDRLVMFYEAVDDAGDHQVGVADSSDGVQWQRRDIPGTAAPGGPILSKGGGSDWDAKVVGTPYVVPATGGSDWRLYYLGQSFDDSGTKIGLADSVSGDLSKWEKR